MCSSHKVFRRHYSYAFVGACVSRGEHCDKRDHCTVHTYLLSIISDAVDAICQCQLSKKEPTVYRYIRMHVTADTPPHMLKGYSCTSAVFLIRHRDIRNSFRAIVWINIVSNVYVCVGGQRGKTYLIMPMVTIGTQFLGFISDGRSLKQVLIGLWTEISGKIVYELVCGGGCCVKRPTVLCN